MEPLNLAPEYISNIIADHKKNPRFEKGMRVSVFAHDEWRTLKGYGSVEDVIWSEFYCQYLLHIQMDGGAFEHALLESQAERCTTPIVTRIK